MLTQSVELYLTKTNGYIGQHFRKWAPITGELDNDSHYGLRDENYIKDYVNNMYINNN